MTIENMNISRSIGQWLDTTIYENSILLRINYHLASRIALLCLSLRSLAEMIGHIAMSSLASVNYLISCGFSKEDRYSITNQIEKAATSFATSLLCLYSIFNPKNLIHYLPKNKTPRSAAYGLNRYVEGAKVIKNKLDYQFNRCQKQAAQEWNKRFQYLSDSTGFRCDSLEKKVADIEVGVCHSIGRRDAMEDTHLATSFNINIDNHDYPVQLFGVFDGHGGSDAAIFVQKNLKSVLQKKLQTCSKGGLSDEAVWNALKETLANLSDDYRKNQAAKSHSLMNRLLPLNMFGKAEESSAIDELSFSRPGTTATVAMILDGKLWTANVGDSRTLLDNGIQLSEDAKPTDLRYKQNIYKRGGTVSDGRVNGQLAVARAIGDEYIRGVNPRPKITVIPLSQINEGSHLILTCDGITDVASTRQLAQDVRSHRTESAQKIARDLVYSAYEAGSQDNLTAMVVKLC